MTDKFIWIISCLIIFLPWSRVHPLPQFPPQTATPYWSTPWNMGMLLDASVMARLAWIVWHGDILSYTYWLNILHSPPRTPPQTRLSKAFPPNHLQNFECQSDFSDNNILPPHAFKPMKKIVQPFHQRNQQTLHCQKKFMTIKQCGGLGAIKPRS
jgi:hypothetical protein